MSSLLAGTHEGWTFTVTAAPMPLVTLRPGERTYRVHYSRAGSDVERSCMLLLAGGEELELELVLAAIEEHASR